MERGRVCGGGSKEGLVAVDTAHLSQASADRRFSLTVFAFGAVLSVLYGLYLFQNVQLFADYDQMVYLNNVKHALNDVTLYNPHHIHFEELGREFHLFMTRNFGDAGFTDLSFNLRLRSAFTAVLGFFFAFLFSAYATRNVILGAAGALAVGFSHGYIHYATKVDTPIFPAAAFILILAAFVLVNQTRRFVIPAAVLLGVAFFIGVVMHQYIAIACVVTGLMMFVPDLDRIDLPFRPFARRARVKFGGARRVGGTGPPRGREQPRLYRRYGLRIAATLVAGAVGIAMIVGAYLWVGKGIYNLRWAGEEDTGQSVGLYRYGTFQQWLFSYATTDSWGYGLEFFHPWRTARGFTDAFVTQYEPHLKYNQNREFGYDLDDPLKEGAVPYNLVGFFTIGSVALSILLFPFLLKRYGRIFLLLLFMLIPYFLFFTYWEPFYFEFWLVPVISMALLGLIIVNYIGEAVARGFVRLTQGGALTRSRPARGDRPAGLGGFLGRLPAVLAFCVFVGVIATHNISENVIPYSREEQREGTGSWTEERVREMYSEGVYRRPLSTRWDFMDE